MHSKSKLVLLLVLATAACAAEPPPPGASGTSDPAYHLNAGDRIVVNVFGEGDLGAQQVIDRDGRVRLPLLGAIQVAGRTIREAEKLIEEAYRNEEILRLPQITLTVDGYAPREVTLLGAVRSPGTFQFPPDVTSMDIRDVIARQGGFTPVAKRDSVAVTRRQPNGSEVTTVVDVARLMSNRTRDSGESFLVQPGDRLFVPERLF